MPEARDHVLREVAARTLLARVRSDRASDPRIRSPAVDACSEASGGCGVNADTRADTTKAAGAYRVLDFGKSAGFTFVESTNFGIGAPAGFGPVYCDW